MPFRVDISHITYDMYDYGMRLVLEHKSIDRKIKKAPRDVQEKYEKWTDIVQQSGPVGLRTILGFNDEALRGERKGSRSSRLSKQYRVIYQIKKQEVVVSVIDITAHDYRKR